MATLPFCAMCIFYTASYYHEDNEPTSIKQTTPSPPHPNLIESTAYQRLAILHFCLLGGAVVITKIIGWFKTRTLLLILQFVLFVIDIYRYFAIREDGKKRVCKQRDTFLAFIFSLFVIVVTYYYTSSAYQYLKGVCKSYKEKTDASKGLLKDFDEDKLRLISRDNRDIIKDLRTGEWHKV